MVRYAALVVVGLLAVGCGDGEGGTYPSMNWGPASNELFKPTSGGETGIVGDWFPCKDQSCSTLDDSGYRFTKDGTWVMLDAPGSTLDAGEQYCVRTASSQQGTYKLQGAKLTLTMSTGQTAQAWVVSIQGDTAKIQAQEVQVGYMRRISPQRESGPCEEPQPMPIPGP